MVLRAISVIQKNRKECINLLRKEHERAVIFLCRNVNVILFIDACYAYPWPDQIVFLKSSADEYIEK